MSVCNITCRSTLERSDSRAAKSEFKCVKMSTVGSIYLLSQYLAFLHFPTALPLNTPGSAMQVVLKCVFQCLQVRSSVTVFSRMVQEAKNLL